MAAADVANRTDPGLNAGRDRILDEAAGLFVESGFAETSMRDIASASGMQAGSVYYHFGSKNEILEAVFARGMAVMVEAFDAAARSTGNADAATRIGAHIRAHLGALFENGPFTAAHVTAFRTAPSEVHHAVIPLRDAYEASWTALLDQLVDGGELASDTPVGLVRLTLFGAMNASIEWFDPARGNLDELADIIARQFLTGVAA